MLSKGWSGEDTFLCGKKGAGAGSEHCGEKKVGISGCCGAPGAHLRHPDSTLWQQFGTT